MVGDDAMSDKTGPIFCIIGARTDENNGTARLASWTKKKVTGKLYYMLRW